MKRRRWVLGWALVIGLGGFLASATTERPAFRPRALALGSPSAPGGGARLRIEQTDDYVEIETDALQARIRKKGYVSGLAQGSFLDKKTQARDLGFGLHIMDFLLAPGWRDDGYSRDPEKHGNRPKHYIEGPQICTQAKELQPEVIQGPDVGTHFVNWRVGTSYTLARNCWCYDNRNATDTPPRV